MYLSIEGFWAMKRVNFGGLSLVIASLFVLIMSFPASAKEVRNEVEFNSTKKLINLELSRILLSICHSFFAKNYAFFSLISASES